MMYEQIQYFLTMVDEEECRPIGSPTRRVEFLKAMDRRSLNGERTYRVGQAFVNALRGTEYYKKLTQSPYDCFFTDREYLVHNAIDFLCRKGPWEK